MNGLEWVFSFALAAVFFITGMMKVFYFEKTQELLPWVKDVPKMLVKAIGVAEMLGALGLILPVITGVLPWLTPVSAAALALLMFCAGTYHSIRHEHIETGVNVLLLILLVGIAYVRWPLMP